MWTPRPTSYPLLVSTDWSCVSESGNLTSSDIIWLLDILSNRSLQPKTFEGTTPSISTHFHNPSTWILVVPLQRRWHRNLPFPDVVKGFRLMAQPDGSWWITHWVWHGNLAMSMCRRFIHMFYHVYTCLYHLNLRIWYVYIIDQPGPPR